MARTEPGDWAGRGEPRGDSPVEARATLYYLAEQRIDETDLAPPRRQR
ncbi:MAG TPA: hypothetical protein VJT72_16860 [Pseudonocardiaceae bacterium]|nr:hypothetical protein [Pseudonocardiaceae bacterium]